MSREVRQTRPQLRLIVSEPAEHRREIATFIAAIEQGKPAEDAVALIGLDRDTGANRILSALLEPC
jgi:hypothetical protein